MFYMVGYYYVLLVGYCNVILVVYCYVIFDWLSLCSIWLVIAMFY